MSVSDDDFFEVDEIPDSDGEQNIIHCVPNNDLREHITGKAVTCWCQPEIQTAIDVDGYIVVHNSLDGREKYESGERKVS
jgi:hypothetical protein